jgi:site-specific recombinase XerC
LGVSDLRLQLPEFERSLRAAAKSPKTIKIYTEAAGGLIAFLVESGMPTEGEQVKREHVEAYIVDHANRWKPAAASQRYRSLARFWKYLEEEGEVKVSPMVRMKRPKVPEERVPVTADVDLRKLLAVGEGNGLEERRDLAMIRPLMDSGMRAGELTGMRLGDLDRDSQMAFVVGKGRRPRACPYGSKAGQA